MAANALWYGDNLDVLREEIRTESVDLIYLDPPFNSNRSYNVLFGQSHGDEAQAQIQAFDDTWTWTPETEQVYLDLISGGAPSRVADALQAMHELVSEGEVMAYLVMMTARLTHLHRVLKPTGSLYLHCDPTASHYLKLILDAIFGPTNFRNEIIWRRTGAHGKTRRFGPIHDTLLFYTRSDTYTWNPVSRPYMLGHVEEYFVQDAQGWRTNYYGNVLTGSGRRGGESGQPWRGFDPTAKNRHWAIPGALVEDAGEDFTEMSQHEKLDRLFELGYIKIVQGQAWPIYERRITREDGQAVGDIWAFQPYTGARTSPSGAKVTGTVFGTDDGIDEDVRWLAPRDQERLGYQTQKPLGLLKRIIAASSNEGDVVLDPFCGCGTTVAAAEALDRHWIGIDITFIAIDLIRTRLEDAYGPNLKYELNGIPRDMGGAKALFGKSPFDFERWAVSLVKGQPNAKQVGDKGIDGVIRFPIDAKSGVGRCLVSVKGGATLNPAMVQSLGGAVAQHKAEMGILITMEKITPGMKEAANHGGSYTWPVNGGSYPKLQVVTVEDLLRGNAPNLPPVLAPYLKATRQKIHADQLTIDG